MLRRGPARSTRLRRRNRKAAEATDADFNAIASKLTPGALVELQLSVGSTS